MEKELENYKRRNKILTKRIARLQEENAKLVEEVETLEALKEPMEKVEEPKKVVKYCNKCGNELLTVADFSGKIIYVCENSNCRVKR